MEERWFLGSQQGFSLKMAFGTLIPPRKGLIQTWREVASGWGRLRVAHLACPETDCADPEH